MSTTFQHADGRIMVAEDAGGHGGGITSTHHRLATELEAAAFKALQAVEPILIAAVEQEAAHLLPLSSPPSEESVPEPSPTTGDPVIPAV